MAHRYIFSFFRLWLKYCQPLSYPDTPLLPVMRSHSLCSISAETLLSPEPLTGLETAQKLSDAGGSPAAVLLRFNDINEGVPAANGNRNAKREALCALTLKAHLIWGPLSEGKTKLCQSLIEGPRHNGAQAYRTLDFELILKSS